MSTLQENTHITFISKTGDTFNRCVKSEDANYLSAKSFVKCESFVDGDENFEKFEPFGELENGKRIHIETSDQKKYSENLLRNVKAEVVEQENFEETTNFGYIQPNTEKFNFLNSKKALSKKRLSDFFKSISVLCDICDDQGTQRVIKLNRREKIVAAIILKKSSEFEINSKKIFSTKIPEQTCSRCFTKIILLYNRHKNKNTRRKIDEETGQVMDQPSHGYHCQCITCQNQYGALPVLLKGIEEQNKQQSGQTHVEFQPEHTLDVSQSLVNLQPPSGNPVTESNREQVNYQQYLVKYEEDYTVLQPEMHGRYHITPHQSNVQGYSQFEMPESQTEMAYQSTSKTATYLGQTEGDFGHTRSNIGTQGPFDVNFQSQAQYYVPQTHASSVHVPDTESSSCTPEQHLPTLLQELEDKCQSELAGQPSTSSGTVSQFSGQDDKQSKKIMTCVHCDKSFTHKGDFNKHLRKHTKEKPYKCSSCDKMFSHTSNLHRHQRIHSGDRPFRCQYCDKCFNRKDKLESHKNSKVCKNRRNWK